MRGRLCLAGTLSTFLWPNRLLPTSVFHSGMDILTPCHCIAEECNLFFGFTVAPGYEFALSLRKAFRLLNSVMTGKTIDSLHVWQILFCNMIMTMSLWKPEAERCGLCLWLICSWFRSPVLGMFERIWTLTVLGRYRSVGIVHRGYSLTFLLVQFSASPSTNMWRVTVSHFSIGIQTLLHIPWPQYFFFLL